MKITYNSNHEDRPRHTIYDILRGSIIGLLLGYGSGLVEGKISGWIATNYFDVFDLGEMIFIIAPIWTTPIVGLIIGFTVTTIRKHRVGPVIGGTLGGIAKILFFIIINIDLSFALIPSILIGVIFGAIIGQVLQVLFIKGPTKFNCTS